MTRPARPHALTTEDLLRLRMRAQGLAGPPAGGPGTGAERIAATVRRMLAVQGQDWRASRWALGVRTPGTTTADVAAAFSEGRIVRSWPMRGTIHVVPAEDIGWLQRGTGRRVLAGAAKRREFLGLSDATLDRLVEVSVAALRGGAGLVRDELAEIWTEAGIDWQRAWRYHVIWWLCQNGIATFGPASGDTEPRLVLAEEWIARPRRLDGDEALSELASRYAAARGPVSARDLAWWSGLTAAEARRGLALAAEARAIEPAELADGAGPRGGLWVDPALLGSPLGAETPGWHLLPAFDEHLLGYTDRSAQLDPAHFERIVPGRNGMFLATVVAGGRVAGTWKRARRAADGIEAVPLPGRRIDAAALAPEAARWAAFHGAREVPIAVVDAHAAPAGRGAGGGGAG